MFFENHLWRKTENIDGRTVGNEEIRRNGEGIENGKPFESPKRRLMSLPEWVTSRRQRRRLRQWYLPILKVGAWRDEKETT